MIKISATIESKVLRAAEATGKTPLFIIRNAVDNYLEELDDTLDIQRRKHEKTITVQELGKKLGLSSSR
jgi:predicted DNA-binding protein